MFKHVIERAKKGEYNLVAAHQFLAMTYAMLDQREKTRVHVAELLKIKSNYSIKDVPKKIIFKNQVDSDRIISALRKAGLPE